MLLTLSLVSEAEGLKILDAAHGGNLIWTVVIFLIAVPFMIKIVMRPIADALLERDATAARAIEAAERASADAERVRAEVEVRLGEAEKGAQELLSKARDRAESREREIVEAAKTEASNLVEGARKTIRAEQDKAIAAIRNEVVDLSLNAAGQVLLRKVDGEDDRRLVGELITQTQGQA